mgnify:FL=1
MVQHNNSRSQHQLPGVSHSFGWYSRTESLQSSLALMGKPTFEAIQNSFWKSWHVSGFPANSKSHVRVSSAFLAEYLRGYPPQRTANDVKASALKIARAGLDNLSEARATSRWRFLPPLAPHLNSLTSQIDRWSFKNSALINAVRFASTSASLGEQALPPLLRRSHRYLAASCTCSPSRGFLSVLRHRSVEAHMLHIRAQPSSSRHSL